ncbi:MAG TPA: prepilin-type N-terminal cleavage/methylation domain-containing protein, partial [Thermoanaerobaculia bacterium]|nr:prepilin-type N-terminal cleavage/methylation domain-containing protein [Thermoanaerobaculia bacterium]
MSKKIRSQRGLSLIEVLLALAILALSLLALIPMFTLGAKQNASANQLGLANTLVREKLEELTTSPSTAPELAIPQNSSTATFSTNDLPTFYNPTTGAISTATSTPGTGWYPFPFSRSYTVTSYNANGLTTVNSTVSDESIYNVASPP